ncbi:MAG: hypothetical protein MJE68_23645 [Proteobacteria bacterium]|nr:hypothetical protein [Pseudomonadota bacterium]
MNNLEIGENWGEKEDVLKVFGIDPANIMPPIYHIPEKICSSFGMPANTALSFFHFPVHIKSTGTSKSEEIRYNDLLDENGDCIERNMRNRLNEIKHIRMRVIPSDAREDRYASFENHTRLVFGVFNDDATSRIYVGKFGIANYKDGKPVESDEKHLAGYWEWIFPKLND